MYKKWENEVEQMFFQKSHINKPTIYFLKLTCSLKTWIFVLLKLPKSLVCQKHLNVYYV